MTQQGARTFHAILWLCGGLVIGSYVGYQSGRNDDELTDYELKDLSHRMAQIGWENGVAGKDSNWVHVYVNFLFDSAPELPQP